MHDSLPHIVRTSAWLACATVVGMVAVFAATGVGQDPLQFFHPSADYARILLRNPPALLTAILLDDCFIVSYSTLFLSLAALLAERGRPRAFVFASAGLLGLLALLDMVENFHFLTMLAQAEQGLLPSATEIGLQVLESLLKFHVGYLGLFLLGFALPRTTRLERALSNLSWFVQLPVGVLIHVTPRAVAVPLSFARLTYFVVALVLVALAFGPRRATSGSSVRASRLGTMPDAAG